MHERLLNTLANDIEMLDDIADITHDEIEKSISEFETLLSEFYPVFWAYYFTLKNKIAGEEKTLFNNDLVLREQDKNLTRILLQLNKFNEIKREHIKQYDQNKFAEAEKHQNESQLKLKIRKAAKALFSLSMITFFAGIISADVAMFFKKTFSLVSAVVAAVLDPIQYAFLAISGVVEGYSLYLDKTLGQRKTKSAAAAFNILASASAFVVLFVAAANPIGLALIALSIVLFEFYKENYIYSCMQKKHLDQQIELDNNKSELAFLEQKSEKTVDDRIKIRILTIEIAQTTNEIENKKQQRFEQNRQVNFSAIRTLGYICCCIGLICPPVGIAGLIICIGSAVFNAIDKHCEYRATKAIANFFTRKKNSEMIADIDSAKKPDSTVNFIKVFGAPKSFTPDSPVVNSNKKVSKAPIDRKPLPALTTLNMRSRF